MSDKKILVLDIDGTLVNSKKEITPETLKYIKQIQEMGHKVALASGRPFPGLRQYTEPLELARYGGYALSFNGGKVIDCATETVIYQKNIPNRYAKVLYDFAREKKIGLVTYKKNQVITGTDTDDYMAYEARLNHMELCKVDDFLKCVDFDMTKCLMTVDPEVSEQYEKELAALVSPELNVFRSEPYFIEITVQGVDKAESIARLLEHIGMKRENCICCGDGFNDKTMVAYAGIGVAMGNAQQVVKDVADYVTASCDEDGVVEVIRKFILQDEG